MTRTKAYKYCPVCGEGLRIVSDWCLDCVNNHPYYISPKSAVAAIIVDDENKILIVKRGREPKKGTWEFPGGYIDPGETAEIAICREIREELGLEIMVESYLMSSIALYPFREIDYEALLIHFVAKIVNRKMKLSTGEVMEAKFMYPEKALDEDFGFEPHRKAIEEYIRLKR